MNEPTRKTRDEILVDLVARVSLLEQRVAQLEPSPDPWLEPLPIPSPSLSDSPGGESQVGEDDLKDLSPEERAAVEEARRRLATDTGGTIEQPNQGRRAHSDGEVVDLPPVDAERVAKRVQLAELIDLDGEFGVGFNTAYVKGGPLWLYYGNRDYVLGLPASVQQEMVLDVMEDSPEEAREMGADVFKYRGPQGGIPGLDLG